MSQRYKSRKQKGKAPAEEDDLPPLPMQRSAGFHDAPAYPSRSMPIGSSGGSGIQRSRGFYGQDVRYDQTTSATLPIDSDIRNEQELASQRLAQLLVEEEEALERQRQMQAKFERRLSRQHAIEDSGFISGSASTSSSIIDRIQTQSPVSYEAEAGSSSQAASRPKLEQDEVEEKLFMDKRNRLLKFIRDTQAILRDWQEANQDRRITTFPTAPPPVPSSSRAQGSSRHQMASSIRSPRRANTMLPETTHDDDEDDIQSVGMNRRAGRSGGGLIRRRGSFDDETVSMNVRRRASDFDGTPSRDTMTTSLPALPEGRAESTVSTGDDLENEQLRVLKLDIKLNMVPSTGQLQVTLDPASLAPMLEDRIAAVLRHLDNLHERVSDTSFKVIVAGDVNAGKSSLVNALLRRTVVPVDQQPLTSAFLEVLDARLNDGIEEAHACMDRRIYNRLDPSTYWRIPLRHLEAAMEEWEGGEHSIIKVYAKQASDDSALIHNDGVANLSVIDSPGLNTDSMKTFFLLTRQEEIDVVVFVLNAENTLTLSGREFLEQAGKEKALLFFVVNRFESIRAKERCKRRVLEQIREVSPATYKEADNLVHWVSPTRVKLDKHGNGGDDSGDDSDHDGEGGGGGDDDEPLDEDWKRMERCLRGFTLGRRTRTKLEPAKLYLLNVLSDIRLLARLNRRDADRRIKEAADALEASRPGYDRLLASQRDDCAAADRETEETGEKVRQLTRRRLRTVCGAFEAYGGEPAWPGFGGMLKYVDTIRRSMLNAWEREILECERITLERVKQADARIKALGSEDILEERPRQAELNRLFARTKKYRPLDVRIEPWDLVDVRERIGIIATGIGSVAMLAGNLFGYKILVLNAAHATTTIGMRGLKRSFWFLVGLVGVGGILFIASDMQHAVHRKVARKIRQHIHEAGLIDHHADRIAKRAQAALRFSAQDLRERYQRAVERERSQREKRAQEQLEAKEHRRWFRDMARRAKELSDLVEAVDCEDRMVPL